MNTLFEYIGWFSFLALVLACVSHLTYAVFQAAWIAGSTEGRSTSSEDVLIATSQTVVTWLKIIRLTWVATATAVAVFMSLWIFTDSSFYSVLGYTVTSYAIGSTWALYVLKMSQKSNNPSNVRHSFLNDNSPD